MAHLPKRAGKRTKSTSLTALKRQRTAQLTKLAAQAALLQRRGRGDEAYTLVCDTFVTLGGIYVKFLQGVLLNSPILKRWHNPDKLKVFESLPPVPIDIMAQLQSQLGPERARQISRLQTEPFAAGSFGQVYYGELQNGQPIIIKALRPQIREMLQHDLRLLGLFSRFFLGRHYRGFDLKLDDAIKDFRRATLAETDYTQEAQFATEMYETQRHNPDLIIPRTYLELCTPTLIVQDYVGGISCAEVLQQQSLTGISPQQYVRDKLGSNLEFQLEVLGIALMDGCFTSARIMGDPHPGNVRLLPDNKIALIDFGISAPAPRNRAAFYGLVREWSHMYNDTVDISKLFEQFLRMFVNDLYRALKKLTGLYPKQGAESQQSMMKNVSGVINELFETETETMDLSETMSHGRMLRLFNQVINKGNRLGLAIRFEDTDLLRAAQTYMSLVEALGLRAEVLKTVFAKVVEQQQGQYLESNNGTERQINMSQALEIVNSWLERVATRDPMLFNHLLQQVSAGSYGTVEVAKQAAPPAAEEPETPDA
ncbi:MAG: AarF/ABC1/UbiB kinase family protein [Candidatus Saccharibacteria bacterium]